MKRPVAARKVVDAGDGGPRGADRGRAHGRGCQIVPLVAVAAMLLFVMTRMQGAPPNLIQDGVSDAAATLNDGPASAVLPASVRIKGAARPPPSKVTPEAPADSGNMLASLAERNKYLEGVHERPEYIVALENRVRGKCDIIAVPGGPDFRRQICCEADPPGMASPTDDGFKSSQGAPEFGRERHPGEPRRGFQGAPRKPPGFRAGRRALEAEKTPRRRMSFCLPVFTVMGAQKGGTTALHSYLMLHPSLSASQKKEVHVWDSDRAFHSWPGALKNFRNEREGSRKLFFESTPSYVASTMACQRMATWLPPWEMYVVILRDPVKRFWSEFQMKARRIDTQDHVMRTILKHADGVKSCLNVQRRRDPLDWPHDAEGEDMEDGGAAQHFRDQTSLRECLEDLSDGVAAQQPEMGVKFRIALKRIATQLGGRPDKAREFEEECLGAKAAADVEEARMCFKKYSILRESLPSLMPTINKEAKALEPCVNRFPFEFKAATAPASGTFKSQAACDALVAETCGDKCTSTPATLRDRCESKCVADDVGLATRLTHLGCEMERHEYPVKRLLKPEEGCEGPVCKCYPNAKNFADISRNFLWRGMYYPQLVQCLQHLPREQLIIVENEELRNNVNGTLNRVLAAAGLPAMDYSGVTWDDADHAFDAKYPNFEAMTGWSPDGSASKKIPEEVQLRLRSFYQEPNERLFELLGRRFDHWL